MPAFRPLLLSAALLAGPVDAGATEIVLVWSDQEAPDERPEVEIRAEPVGEPTYPSVVVRASERADLPLAENVAWQLTVSASGYWSSPQVLAPEEVGATIAVPLYRVGELTAAVELPRNTSIAGLEVRFSPAPEAPGVAPAAEPEGTVSCQVTDATARCEVPAGRLDLRFGAPGMIPVYRWGIEVPRHEQRVLRPLVLRPGAAVGGQVVEAGENGPPPPGTRLVLAPLTTGPRAETSARLRKMRHETTPDQRGLFLFEGVAPGTYLLTTSAPGFADAKVYPVEVLEGRETRLRETLALTRPSSLEVTVTPARGPAGETWRGRLSGFDPQLGRLGETWDGEVSAEGTWRQEGLPAGSYELTIASAGGDLWHREVIEIAQPETRRSVELAAVPVAGEALVGEEPATGTLLFESGDRKGRVTLPLRDGGTFAGLLPTGGEWRPVWQSPAGSSIALEPLTLPLDGDEALRLEIPDTRVSGQVVDSAGRPVPDARVTATVLGPGGYRSDTRTDAKGRFELVGLAPRAYSVRARAGSLESAARTVAAGRDEEASTLELVVESGAAIAGQVLGPEGPIAGARLAAWPDVERMGSIGLVSTLSGPDGSFTLELPPGASSLNLLAAAPGMAASWRRWPNLPEEPLLVLLDRHGGTLVVVPPAGRAVSFLVSDGSALPLPVFLSVLGASHSSRADGAVALSPLEAGEYAHCTTPPPFDPARCASGLLAPYGELSLATPAPR